ncbi:uncharacterized protein haspin isoform X2 [Nelusetta ayraudi]|uniref:uncharacterized protein haspin isoform X2 n=1 Tax=Nelusetta ayraudi TaxID=303726 RepID=UPI003F715563
MNELPPKPIFLKTYGKKKKKKKLSAWILPDDRKQAFDSSGDESVFEQPSKTMKMREEKKKGLGCKVVRSACLKEKNLNEENDPSSPSFQLVQQTKTTRQKRKPPSTARALRPPTRKVRPHLTDTSSDEENIRRPLLCQRKSSDQVLPADRFVTRRMPAGCSRTKVAQAAVSILNSSDDFTARGVVSTRAHQGQKRKLPPVFKVSSTESSGNAPDVFSFNGTSSLQDLSLNGSANNSLALCRRKPRFCSTPFAAPHDKRTIIDCISVSDSPPSYSVSRNDVLNSIPATDCSLSPFHLQLSVTKIKNSVASLSRESVESSKHAVSATDGQKSEVSAPTQVSSSEKLPSPAAAEPSGSDELIVGTKPSADSPRGAWLVEAAAAALRSKCTVKLEKLCPLRLHELTQQEEAAEADKGETCCAKSNDDSTRPIRISRRTTASNKQSRHSGEVENAVAEAAALTAKLKEECLRDECKVKIKRVSVVEERHDDVKAHTDVSDCKSDDLLTNSRQSESDNIQSSKGTGKAGGSTVSQESSFSDKDESLKGSRKRKKPSGAPKQQQQQQKKRRRSTSTDRPATNRKACVSGLSVTRWKNKDLAGFNAGRAAHNKTGDCSISEMITVKHKQPRGLPETTMTLSTPVRVSRLNLSSLLTDLTPNTHTWSRLKAALSVHRKGVVLHTPKNSASVFTPRRAELVDVSQDLFASPFRSSLPKGLQSQLVDCEDADLSDAEKVYAECNQQRPLPWEECIVPERMKLCVKIGEGTFGEVFSTVNASGETVALKLIPVEGSEQVNGEDQKTLGEILHEIIISKELSSLKEKTQNQNQTHGFIGLMDLHCVQGCYPPDFLDAWDKFDQLKGSENDRPDFFQKDQIFIILEFEFGGVDLENSNGTLSSLGVAKSILHQVAAALSVAEQELHFEHRDLHWGNVLVRPTKAKKGSFLLNGEVHSLDTKGVLVSIIDYSLSRLEIDDLTVSCDISADEELFMGRGDYQFDIYRMMREENGNNWSDYHPHTNVLWLHYLCSKLLSMKYRAAGGKAAKDARKMLSRFHESVLQYGSATEALRDSPLFR